MRTHARTRACAHTQARTRPPFSLCSCLASPPWPSRRAWPCWAFGGRCRCVCRHVVCAWARRWRLCMRAFRCVVEGAGACMGRGHYSPPMPPLAVVAASKQLLQRLPPPPCHACPVLEHTHAHAHTRPCAQASTGPRFMHPLGLWWLPSGHQFGQNCVRAALTGVSIVLDYWNMLVRALVWPDTHMWFGWLSGVFEHGRARARCAVLAGMRGCTHGVALCWLVLVPPMHTRRAPASIARTRTRPLACTHPHPPSPPPPRSP